MKASKSKAGEARLSAASEVHRQAMHAVIFGLRAWMIKRENDLRSKAKKKAEHGDLNCRKELWEQAEGIAQVRSRLEMLREQYGLNSAGKRVGTLAINCDHGDDEGDTDSPDVYCPTPEEIAAETAKFREGWTEKEHQDNHWPKVQPVDFEKPTNFIF